MTSKPTFGSPTDDPLLAIVNRPALTSITYTHSTANLVFTLTMATTLESQASSSTSLRRSIEYHDAVFNQLLSLIPAKYYIQDSPEEVSHFAFLGEIDGSWGRSSTCDQKVADERC